MLYLIYKRGAARMGKQKRKQRSNLREKAKHKAKKRASSGRYGVFEHDLSLLPDRAFDELLEQGAHNLEVGGLADFHVHSDVPDSYQRLNKIFDEAKYRGLSYLGITDHNYSGNCYGIGKYLKDNNIPCDQRLFRLNDQLTVAPGIEVNCRHCGVKFHLTVFGANRDPALPFNKLVKMEYDRTYMIRNGLLVLLGEFGIDIPREDLLDYHTDCKKLDPNMGEFTKQHLMDYLRLHNYSSADINKADKILSNPPSTGELQQDLFGYKTVKYFFDFIHIDGADVVRLAHEAGGVVCWAHPRYKSDKGDVKRAYNSLLVNGLDGIEMYGREESAYNATYPANDELFRNLLISGGSDKHCDDRRLACMGKSGNEIWADGLTLINKLEELDKTRAPHPEIRPIKEALIANGNDRPIDYDTLMYEAKVNFTRDLLSKKASVYREYLDVDVKDLTINKDFCFLYYEYLISGRVGENGLSPIKKYVEMTKRVEEEMAIQNNAMEQDKEIISQNHHEALSRLSFTKQDNSLDENEW